MYNVKEVYYPGVTETRIYSRVYRKGVSVKREKKELEENPFDGELCEHIFEWDEFEKRRNRSMAVSRNRAINNIYSLARCNVWDWFVTITFDPDKVDRFDYDACSNKLSKWLSNLKREDKELRYIIVPEKHKDGAYHFHGLLSHSPALHMEYSGHDDKKGTPIYNIGRYRFGFTTATQVLNNEAVTKYITKYVTKDLIESIKGKKHFWASRNLSRPESSEYFCDKVEKAVLEAELQDADSRCKHLTFDAGNSVESISYYELKEGEFIGH